MDTLIHEVGHNLGLGHVDAANNIMLEFGNPGNNLLTFDQAKKYSGL